MSIKPFHCFSGRPAFMFKFFVLLVNFSFYVSSPLATLPTPPPFDQFITDATRDKCHLPKEIEPFSGITKDWDFLLLPLKECKDLHAVFETSTMCHEIFDNLKVISCNPNSGLAMPHVHFELSRNVCEDFANLKYEIPKSDKYVGGRLNDRFVCKIACAENYEIMCKVLLWSYQVRSIMEDAFKYLVTQKTELGTDISVDGAAINVVVVDKKSAELSTTHGAPNKTIHLKRKEDEHKENQNLNHTLKSKQDQETNDQPKFIRGENSEKIQNVLPDAKSPMPARALTTQIITENQTVSNKDAGLEMNLIAELPKSTSSKVNKNHTINDEKITLPNIIVNTTVKYSKDPKSNNFEESNFNNENMNNSKKFSDASHEHRGEKDNGLSEDHKQKVKITKDSEKNIQDGNEEQNKNGSEPNIENEKVTSIYVTKSQNSEHVAEQKDDNIVIPSDEFKNLTNNVGENRSTNQFKSTSSNLQDKQTPVMQETAKSDISKAYGDQNISIPIKVTKNVFATSVGYEIQTSSDVTLNPAVIEPKLEKMDDTNEIPPPVQQDQENDLENEGDLQGDYERPDYAPDGLLNTPILTKTENSDNIVATSEKTFENSINDEKIDMSHLYDDLVPRNPGLNSEDFRRTPFPDEDDSHFFFYFLSIVFILMTGYLLFHNKQKIIALIVEGRHERRRRSHGAGYKKLENK